MKATTIKLQGDLLEEIEREKPASQSVTAYVRAAVRRDLDRMKLREAAAEYRALIESDPEEREGMAEWGRANLAVEPPARPGGKRNL